MVTLHLSGSQLAGDTKSPQNPMRIKQGSLGAVKIYVEVHVLEYIHFTYIRGREVLTQTLVVLILSTILVTNFSGIRYERKIRKSKKAKNADTDTTVE